MNKTQFRKMFGKLYSAAQAKAVQNGKTKTIRVLQEECAELVVAASKILRDDVNKDAGALVVAYAEELVDVQIMLIEALTFFQEKELSTIIDKMVDIKLANLNNIAKEKN